MPAFEIYKADGSLQINLASRLTKVLGTVATTAGAAGSIQDENLKNGTPWFTVSCEYDPGPARPAYHPQVTASRQTGILSWSSSAIPAWITYGVYSNGPN